MLLSSLSVILKPNTILTANIIIYCFYKQILIDIFEVDAGWVKRWLSLPSML